jgi:hypothetical protein
MVNSQLSIVNEQSNDLELFGCEEQSFNCAVYQT